MKRLNTIIILTIILIMSFSIVSFASGVGGALDVIQGSNIDPRTDVRYKDYFNLNENNINNAAHLVDKETLSFCDVVIKHNYYYQDKVYALKAYCRFWYDSSSQYYPCFFLDDYNAGSYVANLIKIVAGSNDFFALNVVYENTDSSFSASDKSGSGAGMQLFDASQSREVEIVECGLPVFNSRNDAEYYCNTGTIRNALYDPTVHYSGDDLYFKEFKVTPHVSNQGSKFYFEIYYELSDFALANIDVLNIRFDNQYDMDVNGLSGLFDSLGCDHTATNSIALSNYKNGFKLYLSDIRSIEKVCASDIFPGQTSEFLLKRILGNEVYIDLSGLTIGGVGGEGVYKIVGSHLYCQFYLRANIDGQFYQGKRNDFNYDFLNKSYDVDVWTTNDDSSLNGNFDYTKEGETITSNEYYYNDVTTNDDGTTVNNYYYYDKNGNRKEITEDVYNNSSASVGDININVGGNGSSEYISINPVDFNQFVKGMKNMLEEFDTKGGLFLLIKDVFSMYPPEVTTIVVGAIAAIAIVSIICILRR